jgi:hypothetical protein
MSEYYLASGSTSLWPDNALILYDSASFQYVTGSIQEESSSVAMLAANLDAIYLQRMPSEALAQGGASADLVYLQRMPATALSQGGASADLVYLQRMGKFYPDKLSTIVWLMRARNTANNKYIYWRSPGTPSTNQVDQNTILLNTVESVGSVYEEI